MSTGGSSLSIDHGLWFKSVTTFVHCEIQNLIFGWTRGLGVNINLIIVSMKYFLNTFWAFLFVILLYHLYSLTMIFIHFKVSRHNISLTNLGPSPSLGLAEHEQIICCKFSQGPETLYRRPIQILMSIAPSWGRGDALHFFRKSCCLSDMLNYSWEP